MSSLNVATLLPDIVFVWVEFSRSTRYIGTIKLRLKFSCFYFLVGTCEASRFEFESDYSDSIRFESDGLIFESAAPAVVPQTTLTVQQKNFNRCAVVA